MLSKKVRALVLAVGISVLSSLCIPTVNVYAATTTEQEYYTLISKFTSSQPYDALKVLKLANNDYPNNQDFIKEIRNRAGVILEWSRGSHVNKSYEAAAFGYQTVIDTPALPDYVKNYAKRQLDLANQKKSNTSADEYINMASKFTGSQPYDALNIYNEAAVSYPGDSRIITGINNRISTILEWSIGSHKNKAFSAAAYGYNIIINSQYVNKDILDKTALYLKYANQNKVFYTADEYYNLASSYGYSQPYQALNILIDAYKDYPNDSRFIDGINDRAKIIIGWSIGSHNNKAYAAAISGYDTILNSPADKRFIDFAKRQKERAAASRVPLTSNEYIDLVNQITSGSPYDIATICNEGLVGYPNDSTILAKLNNSVNIIYSWSIGSHNNLKYDAAEYGYQFILKSPEAADYIRNAASRQLTQASNSLKPTTADQYYRLGLEYINSRPYTALNIYSEALLLYSNQNLVDCLNNSANTIIEWSKGTHKAGYYADANYGYLKVSSNPYVDSQIKNTANILSYIASKNLPYSESNKYIVNTNYNITLNEMVVKQMGKDFQGTPYAQTDLYGGGFQQAKQQDVEYYVNPNNFLSGNSLFQFLILSGQAGVSANELNNVLNNKGNLKGQGIAFIQAAQENNINEIYLISHSLLETGNGTSKLANGVTYNGKVVYNMFGVGAKDEKFYSTDTAPNPTMWGAKFAYDSGWFTPADAIIGGARFIGNGYVKKGQDTLYKMKWNPNDVNKQYATDIGWATKQVSGIKNIYDKLTNYILRFDIPTYKDMNK